MSHNVYYVKSYVTVADVLEAFVVFRTVLFEEMGEVKHRFEQDFLLAK